MPRLLDAYCGAGGATRGYQLAGFTVTGIDIAPQPRYCGDAFMQGDALDYLADPEFVAEFDAIHASPPCQQWTAYRRRGAGVGDAAPNLIPATRELLKASGLPWVMENVTGAPLGAFPGSGAVTRAWEKWQQQIPFAAASVPEPLPLEAS